MGSGTGKGRITPGSIERVLERSDLVDIASAYTELHRRGAEHLGRCPFHEERSPSFWVNGTKGVYHCFGCGASGDVITFLQAKQGLDFVESIEVLADRYRVQLEYEEGTGGGKPRQSKRRLYELTSAATSFYEAYLQRSDEAAPVRAYLAERHVTEESILAFRLGYSPEAGSVLIDKARSKGFTQEELLESRLATSNGRDFFRGRLMVPIIDRADRTLGFGARKLREEQYGGKYVNSADGPLFHKKRTMFLAPGIAKAAKDAGAVVVVEGYMDVIALWQAGFRNVCAVMGTALTEEQVLELKRLAPRALFAFDPDAAGQVATLRALDQARASDLDVRVVLLPEGEDPADVLHGPNGRERMEELLEDGVTLLHYRTSALLGSGDLGDSSDRDRIYNEAVELFRATPDGPARREQIVRVANALQLDSAAAQSLYDVTGAKKPMQLSRMDSWEPKYRGAAAVAKRIAARPESTAVALEKRLLAEALRLAETDATTLLSELLPPEESFALSVHKRARNVLVDAGVAAFTPARVRDDQELFALVAELSSLTTRETPTFQGREGQGDIASPADNVADLARRVELQGIDRRLGEIRAQLGRDSDTDELLMLENATLKRRMRELNPRL
ncbi:MAG: primase [Thermoleophilia bacterium]|nr:primase [Thermoleophilia bacterium]MCZ4495638.1 primase [Thermoleophilia bacterium]